PCQDICPTRALFRRRDGIVDLNAEWCIGCKSCMAACPYDQLFIDPNTNTAEKCNFCANRLESGLEPACVVVCPTQCRVFGDLVDPSSKFSKLIHRESVSVRRPEYNTRPNIYYIEGSRQLLDPTHSAQSGIYKQGEMDAQRKEMTPPWESQRGGGRAVYDTFHKTPWGEKIEIYLMTKGVSTGLLVLSLLLWWFGFESSLFSLWMPLLSGLLLAATGALLITDLKQPGRFHYILLRPNWRSWMAWGTWFIAADGALTALWVLAALAGVEGLLELLLWPAVAAGGLASIYTGFFFAQASARDLWKGSENTLDIAIQTGLKGAAALLFFATLLPIAQRDESLAVLGTVLFVLVLLHACVLAFSALAHRSGSTAHDRAIDLLVHGPFRGDSWGGAVALGCALPLLLIGWRGLGGWGAVLAGLFAVAGAYFWDRVWVRAGQAVPLS
ncbi:MAG: 4Fe-4S dicluster domain-containing protein, partial [Nitrospinota bacterium]